MYFDGMRKKRKRESPNQSTPHRCKEKREGEKNREKKKKRKRDERTIVHSLVTIQKVRKRGGGGNAANDGKGEQKRKREGKGGTILLGDPVWGKEKKEKVRII